MRSLDSQNISRELCTTRSISLLEQIKVHQLDMQSLKPARDSDDGFETVQAANNTAIRREKWTGQVKSAKLTTLAVCDINSPSCMSTGSFEIACELYLVAIRSPAQAQQITELVNELETKGQLQDISLTGTQWRLIYTSSTASSSGKIGPFIGRVFQVRHPVIGHAQLHKQAALPLIWQPFAHFFARSFLCMQVFPQDQPGQYINKVDFGLVKADLLANYKEPAPDRIDVTFEYINWQLGPLQFKQVPSIAFGVHALKLRVPRTAHSGRCKQVGIAGRDASWHSARECHLNVNFSGNAGHFTRKA